MNTVLLLNNYDVGLTDNDYKICVNDPSPINCMSLVIHISREAILKELEKIKKAKFIEPSIFPFAAPMVCV